VRLAVPLAAVPVKLLQIHLEGSENYQRNPRVPRFFMAIGVSLDTLSAHTERRRDPTSRVEA
jgi:hypothetical protein